MKIPVSAFVLLSLLSAFPLTAQPEKYYSRGARSYLVNYNAIKGNRFLADFAARRFVLIDEGSASDIAMIRKINPDIPILLYKDVVALHASFGEFGQVNRDESAFLHSSEPSALSMMMRGDTASLFWAQDRRAMEIKGYKVFWGLDSLSSGNHLVDTVISSNELTVRLPKSAVWISIATIMNDGSELCYGAPVRRYAAGSKDPLIALRSIAVQRFQDSIRFRTLIESIGDVQPDSVVMVCDKNRNNVLDTLLERSRLIRSGNLWDVERALALPARSYGGYEFIILVYEDGTRRRFPTEGSYTTTINNRIMNDYYGFYVMDVGSSTWRQSYINQALKSFSARGYSGLFEDDTWYRVESWGVDAFPPFAYNEYRWRENLYGFLDSIKLSIAPRPAYFNGLYAAKSDSLLLHADGGMTEGFGYTHWSAHVTGGSWKNGCNIGLRTQHQFNRVWMALGGAPSDNPDARLYVLGSYLLVADSLSMFGNATDYQEFAHYPEFDIPLGKPLTFAVSTIDELQRISMPGNTPYYAREFELGTVVVNPDPAKPVLFNEAGGRKAILTEGGITVSGGRIKTKSASDTIYPQQAKIYLNPSPSGDILSSPVIESITVAPNPVPADGQTRARIRALLRDDSSPVFRSDSTLPLWVVADLGELGGPKALRLNNDGASTPGVSSWYEGEFTIPVGAPPAGSDIPITVYSTTGLVSVGYERVNVAEADTANLILNFSFEIDNNEDNVPDLWRSYGKGFVYDISGMNAWSGERSVHVFNDSLTDSRGVYCKVVLNQNEPKDLELSGWSKAVDVSGSKNNDYSIYADVYYADGTPLYGQTAQFITGTHDWEYSSRIIRPVKPIRDLNLYVLFRNHTGEAWFDHIALREYSSPSNIESPGARAVIFHVDNYPNPALASATVRFALSRKSHTTIVLYNLLGVPLRTVYEGECNEGQHSIPVRVDGLAPGVYFARINVGNETAIIRMVVGF